MFIDRNSIELHFHILVKEMTEHEALFQFPRRFPATILATLKWDSAGTSIWDFPTESRQLGWSTSWIYIGLIKSRFIFHWNIFITRIYPTLLDKNDFMELRCFIATYFVIGICSRTWELSEKKDRYLSNFTSVNVTVNESLPLLISRRVKIRGNS